MPNATAHSICTCRPPVVLPLVSMATQMYLLLESQFSSLNAYIPGRRVQGPGSSLCRLRCQADPEPTLKSRLRNSTTQQIIFRHFAVLGKNSFVFAKAKFPSLPSSVPEVQNKPDLIVCWFSREKIACQTNSINAFAFAIQQ
jgi:hypothetical protein